MLFICSSFVHKCVAIPRAPRALTYRLYAITCTHRPYTNAITSPHLIRSKCFLFYNTRHMHCAVTPITWLPGSTAPRILASGYSILRVPPRTPYFRQNTNILNTPPSGGGDGRGLPVHPPPVRGTALLPNLHILRVAPKHRVLIYLGHVAPTPLNYNYIPKMGIRTN